MMNKKILIAAIGMLSVGSAFAADTTTRDPTLHQATSCAEVQTVVTDYLKSNWNAGQFYPMVK